LNIIEISELVYDALKHELSRSLPAMNPAR